VGAIVRTAAVFGVRGVVTMRDRAAPLSAVVYDVASGGLEVVPFALEVNLRRVLELAKAAGVWIVGSAEQAETAVQDVPRDRPWLLVLGREDQGLRRLTLEHCDVVCGIESRGALGSLNVSVAAGVLIETLSRP
jgi:23S rRNA (guanosine2251-2'-O)-methyltransferase